MLDFVAFGLLMEQRFWILAQVYLTHKKQIAVKSAVSFCVTRVWGPYGSSVKTKWT